MRRALAGLALGALLAACGTNRVAGIPGAGIRPVDPAVVPATLNGLAVGAEDVKAAFNGPRDTYVDQVGLFSMRKADVVQATLQLSHLSARADLSSPKFEAALVNQVGGSAPLPTVLGDTTVYLTQGTKQRVYVWFERRWLLILSVRDDYDQPRTLLRSVLAVRPA